MITRGSVHGEYGLPVIDAKRIIVRVDGDIPRGIVAFDAVEGWAELLVFDDRGMRVTGGENDITRRMLGKIEVVEL